MKSVSFTSLPTVKVSGEFRIGQGRKAWLTVGTEGVECSPIHIEVPHGGSGDLDLVDLQAALSTLVEGIKEVVIAQLKSLEQSVKTGQL